MADERRVVDYFVMAGLTDDPKPIDDFTDSSRIKRNQNVAPITDITVIFPGLGESCPPGYVILDKTPSGYYADLNHGSLRSPEVYLCYRRGRDKPPLVDIGVFYEYKDRLLEDSELVKETPTRKPANVNNSNSLTFLTYRRAAPEMPANELVVIDICIIIPSKGEKAPHTFNAVKKNLNRGLVGSDVYLCYKKSMSRANHITYQPGILCRYPIKDRPGWELPPSVPMFCLPMGASLEVWTPEASQPKPVFSTFVLTVSDAAEKVYGAAITFYEKHPSNQLTEEQFKIFQDNHIKLKTCKWTERELEQRKRFERHESASDVSRGTVVDIKENVLNGTYSVNVIKCICLLSHWPFFDTFDKFLFFLYEYSCTGPHSVPLERYISHFLEDMPFPSPQRPNIRFELYPGEELILTLPENLPLPRSGAGFRDFLLNLGPEHSLLVLLLGLTEHKILVHSLRPSVLTAVVEALSLIMFPFKWQCPYIPLCPLGLAQVLDAPLPFLIGVDSRFFDLYEPPSDVTCIDLDTNSITQSEEKGILSYKMLPKKAARQLRNTLERLFEFSTTPLEQSFSNTTADYFTETFKNKKIELKLELEIQDAFLRFMATILKGYRPYLLPITNKPTVGTTDPSSLFDWQGFIRTRDKTHHKFFAMIKDTQMFIRFIEERSFVSDLDAGLAFFDECTDKIDEDVSGMLLEVEDHNKSQSELTVFVAPPEPTGLPPGALYQYDGFNLDYNLFKHHEKRRLLNVKTQDVTPGSPMARRTKHEVKSAQKIAQRRHVQSPRSWANYLLSTCYSLWFIHLPSYVLMDTSKSVVCLRTAYDLLVKIQKLKLQPADEVCYRVMMQLCGVHSQPVLAVKLLSQMKKYNIQPNALTYGYYNRAVLEATWPSEMSQPSKLWNKLRNVVFGAAKFRHALQRGEHLPQAASYTSIESLEKSDRLPEASVEYAKLDKYRSRVGSIVRSSHGPLLGTAAAHQPFESMAGLLMTGSSQIDGPLIEEPDFPLSPPATKRRSSCAEFEATPHPTNTNISPEESKARLRRTNITPTVADNSRLKKLLRSDSFANDTAMLEKLNNLKRLSDNKLNFLSPAIEGPGESSESLDNLDSVSQDSGGDRKLEDTPTKRMFSNVMSRLSSDSLLKHVKGWSSSQDSVDEMKSEWRSSDGLLSPEKKKSWPHDGRKSLSHLFDGLAKNSSKDKGSLRCYQTEHLGNEKSSSSELSLFEDADQKLFNNTPNGEVSPTSPSKVSPIRTPVTENDPLGALILVEDNIIETPKLNKNVLNKKNEEVKENDNIKEDVERLLDQGEDGPVLFQQNVPKSATFHHTKENDISKTPRKNSDTQEQDNKIQRSTTLPDTAAAAIISSSSSVAASLSHLSSSFKLPFSRYSPSRFSLKKSDLRITSTHLLENALSGSKKSNEIILGGINSLKSAATSVAKKIDEIKGAISVTSTPVKSITGGNEGDEEEPEQTESFLDLDYWGNNLKDLFSDGSRKGSSANLNPSIIDEQVSEEVINETLYGKLCVPRNPGGAAALIITMTTCSRCHNCGCVLHDEEIMSGWAADDSNLNTKCHFCEKSTLPFLVVTIYDYRGRDKSVKSPPRPTSLTHSFLNRRLGNSSQSVNGSLNDLENRGCEKNNDHVDNKINATIKNETEFSDTSKDLFDVKENCIKLSKTSKNIDVKENNIEPSDTSKDLIAVEKNSIEFSDTTKENSIESSDTTKENSIESSDTTENCIEFSDTTKENSIESSDTTKENSIESSDTTKENSIEISDTFKNIGVKNSVEVSNDSNDVTAATVENSDLKVCSKNSVNFEPFVLEPIIVPYLNPLVLRKELENVLQSEGDPSLTKSSFVDQHPIIYWNLVWVFERINVVSHIPGLALNSCVVNKSQTIHPSWSAGTLDHTNVFIKCLWDNPRLHEEVGLPMYILWQQTDQESSLVSALITERVALPRGLMTSIIHSIRCSDLCDPLRKLSAYRDKVLSSKRDKTRGKSLTHCHSLYRDILYLSFVEVGRDNIDLEVFDKEYTLALEKLETEEGIVFKKCDKPPVSASFRNYFRPLLL